MTFEQILKIIPRVAKELESGKTHKQIAADLEADIAREPSALNLKPMKERAKRGANKPKATTLSTDQLEDLGLKMVNGHDAGETQQ